MSEPIAMHYLAEMVFKTLCCKNGCGWLTQSRCSKEIGQPCECLCHNTYAALDTVVEAERQAKGEQR